MSFFDAIQKTLTSPFWKDPFCLCRFKMLYSKLRPSPATTSATIPTPTPAPKHKLKSKWWDRERGIYGKRGGSLILLILSCHLGSGAGKLWRGEFGRLLVLLYFHILWCLWMEAKISNPVFGLGTYRPTEDVYRQMHHSSSQILFSRH